MKHGVTKLILSTIGLCLLTLLFLTSQPAGQVQAQNNPTPIVIDLTPTVTPTATTGPGGVAPDYLEPNDEAAAATVTGLGMLIDLTLTDGDVDYFSGYAKAGQHLEISTWVDGRLDTSVTIFWQEQLLAVNDDRSALDLGSTAAFSAPEDGYFIALVEQAGPSAGGYVLEIALIEPTATHTPAPTATPEPTSTPLLPADIAEPNNDAGSAYPIVPGSRYQLTVGHGDVDVFLFLGKAGNNYSCQTVTSQVDTVIEASGAAGQMVVNDDRGPGRVDSYVEFAVESDQTVFVTVSAIGGSFGPYEFGCDFALPAGGQTSGAAGNTHGGGQPAGSSSAVGSQDDSTESEVSPPPITATVAVSDSHIVPLMVRPVGTVVADAAEAVTAVRLIIYYDANNDRQPSPGEGVPNVSVVAVDSTGQQIARVFTNSAGEAIFNLRGDVARVIVPFVSGWSTVVRTGQVNEEIRLGLPAVIIPRFFPVETPEAE